jgi:prefoldin subunit 5
MIVDYTITIGNMIEIAAMVGGGILVILRMNNNLVSIKSDVSEMQDEIKALGKVLTQMAVTDTRVASLRQRLYPGQLQPQRRW